MTSSTSVPIPKHELVDLYRQALLSGVPLEKIEAKVHGLMSRTVVSEKVESDQEVTRKKALKKQLPKVVRYGALLVPLFLVGLGIFLVGNAVVPIANYYVNTLPMLQASSLLTPVPREDVLDVNPLIVTQANSGQVAGADISLEPTILDSQLDYTNLSNWFTQAETTQLEGVTETKSYILDIPSLNISNAEVTIGGTDLNKSLIQFPGTAMPGEMGDPVIFGHSVLRQFYNPSEKNSRRYNSIFSTIMTLKKGDAIYITYAGVKYTYLVQDKIEVKPSDTYILNQKYDGRRLKLVTCTPEGTYLRRGVILAELVNNEQT